MKKFRFLLALVVVVTMLSTVALAAGEVSVVGATGTTITYDESGSLVLTIVPTAAGTLTGPSVIIDYDETKWDVSGTSTSDVAAATITDNGSDVNMADLTFGDTNVTTSSNLLTVTFVPLADVDVNGTVFTVKNSWVDMINVATIDSSADYTVEVAGGSVVEDPTVDTATVSEGHTTVAGTNGTIYNNVWVGEYSATAEDGAALTSMTVSFKDGAKVFNVADHKTVEGEATLEFSIALIGVPTSENLAGTVAATAAWVN